MEVGPKFILQHLDEGMYRSMAGLCCTWIHSCHKSWGPRMNHATLTCWIWRSMNPSLSPTVGCLSAHWQIAMWRGRDTIDADWKVVNLWMLPLNAQRSSHKPHTERGGRAFGVKHPARWRGWRWLRCQQKKTRKEGYTTIRYKKKTLRTCSCTPTQCQIRNVTSATVLKVVSTVGNSTIRYHQSLTLGDIFKSWFLMGKKFMGKSSPPQPVRNLSVTSGEKSPTSWNNRAKLWPSMTSHNETPHWSMMSWQHRTSFHLSIISGTRSQQKPKPMGFANWKKEMKIAKLAPFLSKLQVFCCIFSPTFCGLPTWRHSDKHSWLKLKAFTSSESDLNSPWIHILKAWGRGAIPNQHFLEINFLSWQRKHSTNSKFERFVFSYVSRKVLLVQKCQFSSSKLPLHKDRVRHEYPPTTGNSTGGPPRPLVAHLNRLAIKIAESNHLLKPSKKYQFEI